MKSPTRNLLLAALLCGTLLVVSDAAHALRCGSKLVLEGMLEQEVIELCGEPASVRHLGYVVRSYHPLSRRYLSGSEIYRYGDDYYQDVPVTVYIYNFGPRKLMRRLRFEDGKLTDIETLGSGYVVDDED